MTLHVQNAVHDIIRDKLNGMSRDESHNERALQFFLQLAAVPGSQESVEIGRYFDKLNVQDWNEYRKTFREYLVDSAKIYKPVTSSGTIMQQRKTFIFTEILGNTDPIKSRGSFTFLPGIKQDVWCPNEITFDNDVLDGNSMIIISMNRVTNMVNSHRIFLETLENIFIKLQFAFQNIGPGRPSYSVKKICDTTIHCLFNYIYPYVKSVAVIDSTDTPNDVNRRAAFTHGVLTLLSQEFNFELKIFQPSFMPSMYPDVFARKFFLTVRFLFVDFLTQIFTAPLVLAIIDQFDGFEPSEIVVNEHSIQGVTVFATTPNDDSYAYDWKSETFFIKKTHRDLIDDLFNVLNEGDPEELLKRLDDHLAAVKYALREHPILETRYNSRYLLGKFVSLSHTTDRIFVREMTGSHRTEFLIQIGTVPSKSIMLIFYENVPKQTISVDEMLVQQGSWKIGHRQSTEDVVVITIEQNYVHSRDDLVDSMYDSDFVKYRLTLGYAFKNDIMKNGRRWNTIECMSWDTILQTLTSNQAESFERLVDRVFQSHKKFFTKSAENFRAFLDGLFSNNNNVIKNLIPIKTSYTASQYTVFADYNDQNIDDGQYLRTENTLFHDDMHAEYILDQGRGNRRPVVLQPRKLITVNFNKLNYNGDKTDLEKHSARGMMSMVDESNKQPKSDSMDFFNVVVFENQRGKIMTKVMSKSLFMEKCS